MIHSSQIGRNSSSEGRCGRGVGNTLWMPHEAGVINSPSLASFGVKSFTERTTESVCNRLVSISPERGSAVALDPFPTKPAKEKPRGCVVIMFVRFLTQFQVFFWCIRFHFWSRKLYYLDSTRVEKYFKREAQSGMTFLCRPLINFVPT